jgi:dihydrofolate reductase
MKTQYYTACSLDGFIATEDHSLDWLHGLGDVEDSSYPEFIQQVGLVAMGSSTYEWVIRHLAAAEGAAPEPWPYEQPTWVFTTRDLPRAADNVHFVRGDVRVVHDRMRRACGGRNIWLAGGGDLVGQFHDAGLLDEIIVQIGAAVLGSGRPLLPRRIAFPPLALTSVRTMGTGFVELRYDVPRVPAPRERQGSS